MRTSGKRWAALIPALQTGHGYAEHAQRRTGGLQLMTRAACAPTVKGADECCISLAVRSSSQPTRCGQPKQLPLRFNSDFSSRLAAQPELGAHTQRSVLCWLAVFRNPRVPLSRASLALGWWPTDQQQQQQPPACQALNRAPSRRQAASHRSASHLHSPDSTTAAPPALASRSLPRRILPIPLSVDSPAPRLTF
jgi:hypothetical protein